MSKYITHYVLFFKGPFEAPCIMPYLILVGGELLANLHFLLVHLQNVSHNENCFQMFGYKAQL